MILITILFLINGISVQSLDCPVGQLQCGSNYCYDQNTQGCINGGTTIQCINSCNGTCYSNSQYCYNNTAVCNNGESVCDVKNYNYFSSFPYNITCYNSSQLICSNNTLCYPQYSCGGRCLTDYYSVCANNRTICSGYYYWNYYYTGRYVNLCGSQQICYDNSTHSCVNGTTVCRGLNARLCGSTCYNPDSQTCTNGVVRCINSCNGTCYSNSQYCYNNTAICNNGEAVCDVKNYNSFSYFPYNITCYNSSQLICSNNTLCYPQYSCGGRCLTDYYSVCANNRTICSGYYYWDYYYTGRYMNVCGSQQICYDNSTHSCVNGTTVCRGLNARLCGSTCYNPDSQTCTNGVVRCINSCNGTCYSNSQYCYNNTAICNNGESVCDVKNYNYFSYFPYNITCYNSSQLICSNNTLCYPQYSCGGRCLSDYNSVCANNRTICSGFYYWDYYYTGRYMNVCGSRQICYDNSTHSCVNGTTVCRGLNARLCGSTCYNPDSQTCNNGVVRCINSCNGTCYSNSQYCYNNTAICNNGESVCDVKNYNYFSSFPYNITCYNSSQLICSNNTLCYPQYSCGGRCLTDYYSVCVNNRTICSGFNYWNYYYTGRYMNVCGPRETCYDNSTHVCLASNGTVCPIGNQLCSGLCYNPLSQYCIGGNNSIFCLNNPSSSNCVVTTTPAIPAGGCNALQNCTMNADCCQSDSTECQCYRHVDSDVYGTCLNPYVTPMCGDSCAVRSRCRSDSDCCRNQCAELRFTDADGQIIVKKRCVPRS